MRSKLDEFTKGLESVKWVLEIVKDVEMMKDTYQSILVLIGTFSFAFFMGIALQAL